MKYRLVLKYTNLDIKISNELTGAALTVNAEHDRLNSNSAPIVRCERKETQQYFFFKKMVLANSVRCTKLRANQKENDALYSRVVHFRTWYIHT